MISNLHAIWLVRDIPLGYMQVCWLFYIKCLIYWDWYPPDTNQLFTCALFSIHTNASHKLTPAQTSCGFLSYCFSIVPSYVVHSNLKPYRAKSPIGRQCVNSHSMMTSRAWVIGMAFLTQTTIGILTSIFLLFHYLCLCFIEYKSRATDLTTEHLNIAHTLIMQAKWIPLTRQAFGLKYFS